MSENGEAGANRRGEPRVPFDGAVRLRYRLFQKFLEENAANISSGGMFIRTIHPGEPGSELDFEIRLDDDFTLIRGRGEVAWVRRGGEGPGHEVGMGIRFVDLPDESRALVDKIVDERVAAGLELFDLARQAPAAPAAERPAAVVPPPSDDRPIWQLDAGGAAAGDSAFEISARPPEADGAQASGISASLDPERPAAAAPPAAPQADREPVPGDAPDVYHVPLDPEMPVAAAPPAPPPTAARRPPAATAVPPESAPAGRASPLRLIAVAVVSALIGAGAVLTFYWFYVQPSIDSLETRIDELAGSPGGPWAPPVDEPGPAVTGAGDAATEASSSSPGPRPGESSEVVDALRGWAAAWSEQRVDDYLAYYAATFEPPDGLDRAAWEEARRARIVRPRWIRVALTLVQVQPEGPDAAEVRFVQSYRSERYKDLVKKRVRMVGEDGAWKIAAERTEP